MGPDLDRPAVVGGAVVATGVAFHRVAPLAALEAGNAHDMLALAWDLQNGLPADTDEAALAVEVLAAVARSRERQRSLVLYAAEDPVDPVARVDTSHGDLADPAHVEDVGALVRDDVLDVAVQAPAVVGMVAGGDEV
jgi:hypothetical protein